MLLAGLALSLPRMAMQSQRLKDERLIERGEQYRRAIELYFREHKKYPEDLDDLEETDGVRYLRRRHDDPMGETGEWRLIHMGTDGRFEDSLLFDVADERDRRGSDGFGGTAVGISSGQFAQGMAGRQGMVAGPAPGSTFPPIPPPQTDPRMRMQQEQSPFLGAGRARSTRESAAPDLAARNRYSQGFEFNAGQASQSIPPEVAENAARPDYSKMLPSEIPMDENEYQALNPYGAFDRQGQDPRFGGGPRGSPGGVPSFAQEQATQARTPSSATANQAGLGSGSGASGMINRLLTTPRPGGMAGAMQTQSQVAAAPVFQRGIAGVASKSEDFGVKVYDGKEFYNEWEFVYDYRKDSDATGGPQGMQPGAVPGMGSGGMPGAGMPNRSGGALRSRARR